MACRRPVNLPLGSAMAPTLAHGHKAKPILTVLSYRWHRLGLSQAISCKTTRGELWVLLPPQTSSSQVR